MSATICVLGAAGEEEAMTDPWAVLVGLGVVAFMFVLAPVVGSVYRQYLVPRWLRCPETGLPVAVAVDARHAAWTGAFGWPRLRIRSCSLWPRRAGCAQRCCDLPEISGETEAPKSGLR